MNTTPHPYAHIFRAIADGHKTQWQNSEGTWRDLSEKDILLSILNKDFRPSCYRVKPPHIMINGREVPEPLNKMPKEGTNVFWPAFDTPVFTFVKCDTVSDGVLTHLTNILKRGVLHSSREAAHAHAVAFMSFTKNEVI